MAANGNPSSASSAPRPLSRFAHMLRSTSSASSDKDTASRTQPPPALRPSLLSLNFPSPFIRTRPRPLSHLTRLTNLPRTRILRLILTPIPHHTPLKSIPIRTIPLRTQHPRMLCPPQTLTLCNTHLLILTPTTCPSPRPTIIPLTPRPHNTHVLVLSACPNTLQSILPTMSLLTSTTR
ncbi:unnamed protein product [Chondrus crispus]|uniref:Uncharacterized protein n=1 Tax=Chondrus crispus TaxID=2769 RepID=R7QPP2_CHOCR|nr:unnamed protein product [Chondrus crispus]CDF39451.1 unnamed protein product [Chondrus crispus]|eukprot:XP_005719362.1 unnamed protein product [Chondrus crispus]